MPTTTGSAATLRRHSRRTTAPTGGLLFVYRVCQLVQQGDLVGTLQAALRTLLGLQDWG